MHSPKDGFLIEGFAPTVEGEAACSASSRFVSRLRACTAASSATMALLSAGTYAITGGLGGLGLRAASLLVEGGAVGVVLSSRSGRMGGRALEVATSALKRVAACDIGDGADGLALRAFAPPTGVLHAAGVLHDRMLRSMATDLSLIHI